MPAWIDQPIVPVARQVNRCRSKYSRPWLRVAPQVGLEQAVGRCWCRPTVRGPRVRIPFAPPVSLSQPGPADAVGQSRGCGAGPVLFRDVRKGRGGCDPTLFGPVSLSPIDAVPVRESSDRSQRRAGRGGGRGLRHISGLCAQLASSLRCSVQSNGRSSSVRRVAVSSTGCRPCKIASTSSGLKKARPTSRRM